MRTLASVSAAEQPNEDADCASKTHKQHKPKPHVDKPKPNKPEQCDDSPRTVPQAAPQEPPPAVVDPVVALEPVPVEQSEQDPGDRHDGNGNGHDKKK